MVDPFSAGGSRSDNSSDSVWLSQFIPGDVTEYADTASVESKGVFTLCKKDVQSFWHCWPDSRDVVMWKRSRAALAKDSQRQRKAAVRKIIIR